MKFLLSYLENTVSLQSDSKNNRARKAALALISILVVIAGMLWSVMYLALGYNAPFAIALISTLFIGSNLAAFFIHKRFEIFLQIQLLFILLLPSALQWSLGGYANSGSVIVWSFLAPLGSIIFSGLKKSYLWLGAFLLLLFTSTFMDIYLHLNITSPQQLHTLLFFTMNIGAVLIVFFLVLVYFFGELEKATFAVEEKKNQLESLAGKLAKYLSPQVYASIFSGKQNVNIETYRRRLTVFFSDIVGFTDITDNLESESLTELLNDYLNEMANITLKYGGTIDKFMGDAIMVFFGDPESQGIKEDAYACISMAIEMREKMKYLRDKWHSHGIAEPLHIRMGINSGYCTVGNFGSEDRIDYTIVGGQVNLASRLESNATPDQILISDETYLLINDRIHCEKMNSIQVKGITKPVQTYQVIDHIHRSDINQSDIFRKHGQGYLISLDFDKISTAEKEYLEKVFSQALSTVVNTKKVQ